MPQYLRFDSPIHNLQVFLRLIAGKYTDIPSVIPDGVYGDNTKDAVRVFQEKTGLMPTGETDNSTWNKIVETYFEIESEINAPFVSGIYPENGFREDYNSYSPTVYIVQTMLASLSQRFNNIPEPQLSGVIDYRTTESINSVKILSGLNPDGNINKIFWEYLSAIYSVFVSSDRYEVQNSD